jgi:hypothetical protein
VPYTDYHISPEEKWAVDSINTNDQEHLQEECGGNPNCGDQGGQSPILLDLDRDGFRLTGLADPVSFDIDADGILETIGWIATEAGDAFLFRNRYGTAAVDDGGELFGNSTWLLLSAGDRAPNGYLALAELDALVLGGNENGLVDPGDALFHTLGVWVDANHDGVSQPAEMRRLEQVGVVGIDLAYHELGLFDRHGNLLWLAGRAWTREGARIRPMATVDAVFVLGD